MSRRRKWPLVVAHVVIAVSMVAACRNDAEQSPATEEATAAPTETATAEPDDEPSPIEVTRIVVETRVVEVVVSPEPQPEEPQIKELVICLGDEPESLYPYASGRLPISTEHVLHALYEPLFHSLSYAYQPRGLVSLPSLDSGDAEIRPIQVQDGDQIMDTKGNVIVLDRGVTIRTFAGEEVVFEGEPLEMPQVVARFTLKPLIWSDGRPVKADDSVFAFELAADPATPIPKIDVDRTAVYTATGDLALEWAGIPGFLDQSYFTRVWTPLPRHYWGDLSAHDLISAQEVNLVPLSHGPYVIEEWVAGEHIALVRNEHYYLAEEGLPRVDSIRFEFVPNSSQLLAQLLSGQCDIGTHEGLGVNDLPSLIDAEENGLLEPVFASGTIFEHIDFGINPEESYASKHPPWFEDVRVRQAFISCIDRQRIVDEVFSGKAEITHAYVPPNHPLYPADANDWDYDIEVANQLLDESRHLDLDEDGFREDPRFGARFQVTLYAALGNMVAEKVSQIVQENLVQCGIDAQIEFLLSDQYFADGPQGPLFGRRFDLALFPWLIGVEPNCGLYLSSQIPGPENNWNIAYNNETGFQDEAFDEACQMALESLPGQPGYAESHSRAIRIWMEQAPVIPLYMRPKLAAARPGVLNLMVDPTERSELWNLAEFDVDMD